MLTASLVSDIFLGPGPVPVCAADRHPVLPAAPRPAARQRGKGEGEEALPQDHRRSRGPRPEEWSHTLLDSGETQVT